MKDYSAENIRNIGLGGHGGVGKTSLAEALLFNAGVIGRLGSTDDGSTVSDYLPDEIARRISITSSLLHLEWKIHKINILDLPGYSDFVGELIGGLKVIDTAIIVANAVGGIEGGTESANKLAESNGCSQLFFINRMDKEHANSNAVIGNLMDLFGARVVPMQLPIGMALEFKGVVDLLTMKAYYYSQGKATAAEIPGDLAGQAAAAREKLVEAAAESDDALLEKFFDSGSLTGEEVTSGLKKGIASGKISPVLLGSATQNIGIDLLMDFIVSVCPSPRDKEAAIVFKGDTDTKVALPVSEGGPAVIYIFKTISVHHVGELSLFKVHSGKVNAGDELVIAAGRTTERFNQIFQLNGKDRKEINVAAAGDIAATVKLKNSHTGETLCGKSVDFRIPPPQFPNPLHRMGIVSTKKGEEEKVAAGLAKLHEEDPTFFMKVDGDIKQTIVFGQGDIHLEVNAARLRERFGVEVELVKPKIPFRETIKSKAESQGKFKRQSGGRGQYGDCWVKLEPMPRGSGFEFVNAIVGGVIPSKFIPAVEKGIVEAMEQGELAGFRVVDLKASCYDGSYHDVDSSEMAFKIAGSMGFKACFEKANPILLEPIYKVVITVPGDFAGDIMGDISSRRGKIMGMEPDGKYQVVKALAPLTELYKYATALRSMTQGRGTYSMEFSHYEEVPREVQEKIIAEAKAAREAQN
ncbi:MAG: elongation factor G [candidate division Zixibacteria bacterium CG_4_9_14_3_um_filter_46_8]|nr:MAG: elongation factor G [candidate division Zixibacteria bacterium CG_4_9_14_3_um_filter_46_8]